MLQESIETPQDANTLPNKEADVGTTITPGGAAIPPAGPPRGGAFSVGVAFLAALVLFLMIAYFKKGMTHGQWIIIRVLCTICAGFSAGFMTGGLITKISVPLPGGGSVDVDAAGGLGVAVIVWFTFPKLVEDPEVSINIPPNAEFQSIARLAAEEFRESVDLSQLKPEELGASLREGEVSGGSAASFIDQLRFRTATPNVIRPYRATRKNGINVVEVLP